MESLNHTSIASNSHLYLPLAVTDEIRLLSLEPGHANETIKCTLQHTKLKGFSRYEALSYMWGPKEYRTIELEGKPYAVTENLWQALIHLRLEQESRTMWIDAICINQGDGSERNHQVMQMGAIYSHASRVLVWLGLPDVTTQIAFEVCKSSLRGPDHYSTDVKLTFSIDELKAIRDLCYREYWSRLWIVQEVLLAHEILLCCGNLQLNWLNFQFVLRNMRITDKVYKEVWYNIWASTLHSLWRLGNDQRFHTHSNHNAFRCGTTMSLGSLCSVFGKLKCQDVKDRVFGLSGIAKECCKNDLTIDYSIPWSVICTTVLHHYMSTHHTMGSRNTVWTAHAFHRRLKVRSEDYIQLNNKFYDSDRWNFGPDSRTVEATGIVRGEILHIFPLTDTSKGARPINSPSLKGFISPSLSDALAVLIRDHQTRIDSHWHNLEDMDLSCYLKYGLDLVANFPGPLCEVSLDPTEYGDFSNGAIKHAPRIDLTPDEITLSKRWDTFGFDRTGNPSLLAETYSLAVVTGGGSSFVPSQTRVGDVLVDLKGSRCNIIALVRISPEEENVPDARQDASMDSSKDRRCGKLLGRCIDLLPRDEPRHQTREARLFLDLRTLQLLTGVSIRDCASS
ncbi:HET-domain-containing protein [Hyaloscypha variabilis F]|uniref:HET-domain-containing protein n=1 Tax=Hyaloscypha variabilis (strain UAMH 11265 / GT02V1 / F) TaxID=1149755 RepID=A0A2J6RCP0_HYAVF|nr:HET-domain-containing protein [Hyaloscypha variabilis F]